MSGYVKMGLAMALSSAVSLYSALPASAAETEQAGSLTAAVRTEIGKSAALRANHLSVETIGGVVYVRGVVDTETERAEVRAAAGKAAGGAKVINLTELAE